MIILGLHFGHDAGVSVLRDGRLAAFVLRERHARVKHAISLDRATIECALSDAGVDPAQINACALVSTQKTEIIVQGRDYLTVDFSPPNAHERPGYMAEFIVKSGLDVRSLVRSTVIPLLYDSPAEYPRERHAVAQHFPEYKRLARDELFTLGWLDTYVTLNPWTRRLGLSALGEADYRACIDTDASRMGFHYPVAVQLAGRTIPGYFINHHLAHAASAYYVSPFTRAAILTHDRFSGGASYHGGMFYFADGHRIFPLTPHHLVLGAIYEDTGVALNLGIVGAPGKLMGLAPYGQPAFYDQRFVGNWHDLNERGLRNAPEDWLAHSAAVARAKGYDMSVFRDPSKMTAPFNADLAASTQKMFEETLLAAVEAFRGCLSASGVSTSHLCLSGGTALNCPGNSRIFRQGNFEDIFVPPWCDDSGLAAGAALALYHNVFDHPLPDDAIRTANASPYQGRETTAESIARALGGAADGLRVERPTDWTDAAARDLAADRVIGWFEGRSEIGPRALGHRSILADPRKLENWARVNHIKGREGWRPFAPAVLAESARNWFDGAPANSRYMLFTADVRGAGVPAVTHVDRSARIQTVDRSCGDFRRVIEGFASRTGLPVVLNTSLNGPGEPIAETPDDAIRLFRERDLDALYLGGWRITRR